jgi:hypothetical protein
MGGGGGGGSRRKGRRDFKALLVAQHMYVFGGEFVDLRV